MGKNFENVTKDIQETLSILEETKAESEARISATEQRMVSTQDFKRFEKKIEENISRFFANTVDSAYSNNTNTTASTVGITGNVRKRNDEIINDSNTSTKSNSYKRVTLETDGDDNDDDDSSNNVAQISARHNALSMFLSEYKNDQVYS
jgi:hypothetical protein